MRFAIGKKEKKTVRERERRHPKILRDDLRDLHEEY